MLCLDIGCGLKKKDGYIGIDPIKTEVVDMVARVENLPFKNSTIDKIYSRHTLEHVGDFEKAIREMWRVSKPNATIEIIVPFWAHSVANHPTHKRFFNYYSFDEYSSQNSKHWIPDKVARFEIKKRKYIFQKRKFPFSVFYTIIEKLVNKYYNTYESTFANIFPAYEIYFKLQVIK